MNHKQFVFFDCECANTFDGIGKICSLGYVITDDELNIIESQDVVINPECEFDWYLFSGKGGCKLAYSKDYFRVKPNFAAYYKEIKKLFTTGNRLIAGFAVGNDVGFVNSACQRYNENYINIRAFDFMPLLEQHYGQHKKLSEWAEFFGVNVAKYQSHKSVDDAIMTMLCMKKFCIEQKITPEQLMNSHKDLFVSSEEMLIQAEERAYRKEITEKIKRLYDKKNPKPHHKSLLDKHFEFDGKLLKNVDVAFELIKNIYDCGGIVHEHCMLGGILVCNYTNNKEIPDGFKEKAQKRGLEIISYGELQEKM